jgi:hypothetical protein
MGVGGWGSGDWAQPPIPNPQSPIPNPQIIFIYKKMIILINLYNKIKINKWEYVNHPKKKKKKKLKLKLLPQ